MRNKKMLSAMMAGALAVTTMAVPVMATSTTPSGTITVPVTTKTALIRVKVPTALAIAVDQFEKGDAGTQIYSEEFSLENNSEIAVKVAVDSAATLKATTKLVATKEAAENSTAQGEAWVAVTAQTSNGKYIEESGKAIADLTEASPNVTTFEQGTDANAIKGTASQMFYLQKATAATYKAFTAASDAATEAKKLEYTEFYELTKAATAATDKTKLAEAAGAGDLYVKADGSVAANADALILVSKGTAVSDLPTTITGAGPFEYYTASSEATAAGSVADGKFYVYVDGAANTTATSGKAVFRYIGKLSPKQETWTKDDMPSVAIAYTITGVSDTVYNDVKDDCTYGLYSEPAPAPLTLASGKDNTDVQLRFNVAGKTLATNYISINGVDMSSWQTLSNDVTFDASAGTVTIKSQVFGYDSISGQTTDHKYTIIVKDTDGTTYTTGEIDLTPAP